MIAFMCPHCSQSNSVGEEWAGRTGQCAWCKESVEVPAVPTPSAAPIVFPCGHCGHKLSVAGAWAGKWGKCPQCNQGVQIPLSSQADTFGSPKPAAVPVPVPVPARTPQARGEILFQCEHCRHKLAVPGEWAGKPGKCPACNRSVAIPYESVLEAGPDAPPAGDSRIVFYCEQCERKLAVAAAWAGKRRPCPSCGESVQVPWNSTAPRDPGASGRDTYGLSEEDEPVRDRPRPVPVEPPRRKKPLYGEGAAPPRPRHQTDGGGSGVDQSVVGWVIFFLIFVVGNIILYSTTGWILIPRR